MRTIKAFCLAALCMVSVASAQTWQQPAKDDPVHDELRALQAAMEEALNKHDLDGMLEHVDENVAFTAMNAETGYGKQHIRNYFDRMMNGPDKIVEDIKVDFVPDQLAVFYGPDVAVSAGKAASHYELTNGMKFDIDARWTGTLVRKEGRWLVGSFHYSANVFRNPIMQQQRRFMLLAGGALTILFAAVAFIVGRRVGRARQ
jgi:uncharacterized protein (TIGR02246 family)